MTTATETARVPQPGDAAPTLSLRDGEGTDRRLSDERGRWVILYFYPTDDTPGCTTEACGFRDARESLREAGAVVWGVSPQDEQSHQRFSQKFGLNFPLLVDADHAAADAWGTWQQKQNYGRSYMGIARTTFLIDPEGRIARTWERVKADGHVEDVLAALREAQAERKARIPGS
jgi:peroxiredoxin Q/BCP